jgi:lipopolysaccharide export system protein LptC
MAGAGHENLHSRVVAWLKIILPLTALGILSTLFLFSRTIDPSDAIPYATVDVEERAREPRVTAPAYAGVTSDGARLSMTAAEARPGAGTGAGAIVGSVIASPRGSGTPIRDRRRAVSPR